MRMEQHGSFDERSSEFGIVVTVPDMRIWDMGYGYV
jgi:hypothetical protein